MSISSTMRGRAMAVTGAAALKKLPTNSTLGSSCSSSLLYFHRLLMSLFLLLGTTSIFHKAGEVDAALFRLRQVNREAAELFKSNDEQCTFYHKNHLFDGSRLHNIKQRQQVHSSCQVHNDQDDAIDGFGGLREMVAALHLRDEAAEEVEAKSSGSCGAPPASSHQSCSFFPLVGAAHDAHLESSSHVEELQAGGVEVPDAERSAQEVVKDELHCHSSPRSCAGGALISSSSSSPCATGFRSGGTTRHLWSSMSLSSSPVARAQSGSGHDCSYKPGSCGLCALRKYTEELRTSRKNKKQQLDQNWCSWGGTSATTGIDKEKDADETRLKQRRHAPHVAHFVGAACADDDEDVFSQQHHRKPGAAAAPPVSGAPLVPFFCYLVQNKKYLQNYSPQRILQTFLHGLRPLEEQYEYYQMPAEPQFPAEDLSRGRGRAIAAATGGGGTRSRAAGTTMAQRIFTPWAAGGVTGHAPYHGGVNNGQQGRGGYQNTGEIEHHTVNNNSMLQQIIFNPVLYWVTRHSNYSAGRRGREQGRNGQVAPTWTGAGLNTANGGAGSTRSRGGTTANGGPRTNGTSTSHNSRIIANNVRSHAVRTTTGFLSPRGSRQVSSPQGRSSSTQEVVRPIDALDTTLYWQDVWHWLHSLPKCSSTRTSCGGRRILNHAGAAPAAPAASSHGRSPNSDGLEDSSVDDDIRGFHVARSRPDEQLVGEDFHGADAAGPGSSGPAGHRDLRSSSGSGGPREQDHITTTGSGSTGSSSSSSATHQPAGGSRTSTAASSGGTASTNRGYYTGTPEVDEDNSTFAATSASRPATRRTAHGSGRRRTSGRRPGTSSRTSRPSNSRWSSAGASSSSSATETRLRRNYPRQQESAASTSGRAARPASTPMMSFPRGANMLAAVTSNTMDRQAPSQHDQQGLRRPDPHLQIALAPIPRNMTPINLAANDVSPTDILGAASRSSDILNVSLGPHPVVVRLANQTTSRGGVHTTTTPGGNHHDAPCSYGAAAAAASGSASSGTSSGTSGVLAFVAPGAASSSSARPSTSSSGITQELEQQLAQDQGQAPNYTEEQMDLDMESPLHVDPRTSCSLVGDDETTNSPPQEEDEPVAQGPKLRATGWRRVDYYNDRRFYNHEAVYVGPPAHKNNACFANAVRLLINENTFDNIGTDWEKEKVEVYAQMIIVEEETELHQDDIAMGEDEDDEDAADHSNSSPNSGRGGGPELVSILTLADAKKKQHDKLRKMGSSSSRSKKVFSSGAASSSSWSGAFTAVSSASASSVKVKTIPKAYFLVFLRDFVPSVEDVELQVGTPAAGGAAAAAPAATVMGGLDAIENENHNQNQGQQERGGARNAIGPADFEDTDTRLSTVGRQALEEHYLHGINQERHLLQWQDGTGTNPAQVAGAGGTRRPRPPQVAVTEDAGDGAAAQELEPTQQLAPRRPTTPLQRQISIDGDQHPAAQEALRAEQENNINAELQGGQPGRPRGAAPRPTQAEQRRTREPQQQILEPYYFSALALYDANLKNGRQMSTRRSPKALSYQTMSVAKSDNFLRQEFSYQELQDLL
ncbi:unnamed protein product [Amoebophrya sp. A120]|nr:unnamed protein product [Amoebophrya sp. A120]|eukprot:GSA120T00024536001.1